MGWLDSGAGDGYDLLTPEQQALVDEFLEEATDETAPNL